MGYLKIENLYRRSDLFDCYALEKIHGTSSHISFDGNRLQFFSGGEAHDKFVSLFNEAELLAKFKEIVTNETAKVIVYGEAFGGKCQGMSKTYGASLRFMAFDVKIDDMWLDVPKADYFVRSLGLEFVPYNRGPLTKEWLDEQRDLPSRVAIIPNANAEGVVIRPIYEAKYNDGSRVIFKHKRDEFRETATPRVVSSEQLAVLSEANAVADEWTTKMRLMHVLDKCPYNSPSDTGKVIKAMIEDIKVESSGEVIWSKDVEKMISKATVALLKTL